MPTPLKKRLLHTAEQSGMLNLMQRVGKHQTNQLFVLTYHRVDHADHRPWLDPDQISTDPQQFARQMQLLAQQYHPVSLPEVLQAVRGRAILPPDAVLVTVDDGYLDFAENIFPAAIQYGIRPVLFVPTRYVGEGHFWWDRLYRSIHLNDAPEIETSLGRLSIATPEQKAHAIHHLSAHLKRIPSAEMQRELDALPAPNAEYPRSTLNWEELRSLAASGASIAAHTHSHPILTQVSLEDAHQEVRQSQALLREHLGDEAVLPVFAFPDGTPIAVSQALRTVLREEGFEAAFTMESRPAILNRDDALALPRLGTWPELDLAQFHYHLTAWYHEKAE